MSDMSKKEAIMQIKKAVGDAQWAGLTEQEIHAVFVTAILEKFTNG